MEELGQLVVPVALVFVCSRLTGATGHDAVLAMLRSICVQNRSAAFFVVAHIRVARDIAAARKPTSASEIGADSFFPIWLYVAFRCNCLIVVGQLCDHSLQNTGRTQAAEDHAQLQQRTHVGARLLPHLL